MSQRDPRPVTLAVLGCGERGSTYARWAVEHPGRARVVAVAEPHSARRDALADEARVVGTARFASWQECLAAGRLADAALVCTQDGDHVEPALAALAAGYHVLLEKPIAPTAEEVRQVTEAAEASGAVFVVAHVLRYTPHTHALVALLQDDAIGRIVSVQHLEPVGWWHQAHSFVRGNWRDTRVAAPMLLAKSCHDLDWLEYVLNLRITRVASFGALTHFTRENAPAGSTERCVTCPLQDTCAYSAIRIYLGPHAAPPDQWPTRVLTTDRSVDGVRKALEQGPYGRCVYRCDNDAVDHQVVALEFEGGATGTFTMTAFTPKAGRHTRLFGTQGMIETDSETIRVCDFRSGGTWTQLDVSVGADQSAAGGHGGGDSGLMDAFVAAVASGDQRRASSDAASSRSSHLAVFAAEQARHTGRVVAVDR